MRISDWSSDVCSSDLTGRCRADLRRRPAAHHLFAGRLAAAALLARATGAGQRVCRPSRTGQAAGARRQRSEEHTSELQSLMRISYAVFCLKKKKKIANVT